jgi:energy-coupling factor transporter ATP-binding protein EcfA2
MFYDFMTLSPKDFEALTADLLSKSHSMRLESFKAGKDLGIDLRHSLSPDGKGDVIIQCKRYATNKFNELLRSLKSERANLEVLQPSRYIVSTTVSLSPANKQQIVQTLLPWIHSPADIIGPDELNHLLRDHPEVVGAHFKLWISSTAVLERVLSARIFAQTEATLDATRRYASKLVVHAGLNKALELLREQHHVMIVGNPGIGKTTLARMLMCHYMEDDFEPVWIAGNVEDAWTVIHSAVGSDRKFVVVYDDFLGRLRFDTEKFTKNEDASLLSLIDRAAGLPNLRLILTTREYILEDAKRLHGVLNARARDIIKYTLSLAVYTAKERAKMLFNHLYFSDLPNSRLQKLIQTKTYNDVIQHQHFNPRIVESVSNFANSRALTDEQYLDYFRREFDDPAQLWDHPFNREISPMARRILVALWSFNGQAEMKPLEESTRKMCVDVVDDQFPLDFMDAMRQLEGNFIATNRYPSTNRTKHYLIVQFQNPSVEEFIESVAPKNWIRQLISACITFEQVQRLLHVLQRSHHIASKELWADLRLKAERYCSEETGRLINFLYAGEKKAVRTWTHTHSDLNEAKILLTLLKLEEEVNVSDARQSELYSRILTTPGWLQMLEVVPGDASVAFSISNLQKWISKSSKWSSASIALAERSLREGLRVLFNQDNAWPISAVSIYELAQAASCVTAKYAPAEISLFIEAATSAVTTAMENIREPEELREEAMALENLAMMLNVNFESTVQDMRREADAREMDDERYMDQIPPERKRFDEEVEAFDIDELFKGLTDR